MSDARQEGFEVGLRARVMASPQRVEAVIEDDHRFWEIVADLASFERVARQAALKHKEYSLASEGLKLSISFISHLRSTVKKDKKDSTGN